MQQQRGARGLGQHYVKTRQVGAWCGRVPKRTSACATALEIQEQRCLADLCIAYQANVERNDVLGDFTSTKGISGKPV